MTARLSNPTAFEAAIEAVYAARGNRGAAQDLAFDRFAHARLPHRRLEGWRWSDFNAALRDAPPQQAALHETAPPLSADLQGLKPIEFRIVNGRIDIPAGDFPDGIRYGVVPAAPTIPDLESHAIASLNVAMTRKALGIEVAEGVKFARPIVIRHINTGAGFSFAQGLMRLGDRAEATLIETFEGESEAFYSHLFHLVLKDGARLDRAVFHETGSGAIVHSICAAKIEGGAQFNQTSLSTGARLARHETLLHYIAARARAEIASAALMSGDRHNDFTSEVLHIGEGCETRQRHKAVVRDKGRNVFQGKFRVMRSAQRTDARMNADALLLSDMAESNSKPELEIYADDVQCAHGSTSGALDQNAIFYLRQRGLTAEAARAMLIEAFVADTFSNVAHPGIAQAFHNRVAKWLGAA